MRLRRGHSLIEALCALTLSGVLAVASGLAMGGARRALERAEARDIGGRAEREAVAIVRRALQTGAAAVAHGDTALEVDLLIGSGVACGVGASELALLPAETAALTAMPQAPTLGDHVAIRGWSPAVADWRYVLLDSAVSRVDASVCSAADGWRAPQASSQPLLRLVVAESLPADLEPGAEVRVYRRGRFALYHAGGGDWMLGWRRCHPWSGACGPIQPVAGPLRAPGAGGFAVRVDAVSGAWQLTAHGVGGRGAVATVLP